MKKKKEIIFCITKTKTKGLLESKSKPNSNLKGLGWGVEFFKMYNGA